MYNNVNFESGSGILNILYWEKFRCERNVKFYLFLKRKCINSLCAEIFVQKLLAFQTSHLLKTNFIHRYFKLSGCILLFKLMPLTNKKNRIVQYHNLSSEIIHLKYYSILHLFHIQYTFCNNYKTKNKILSALIR